MSAGTGLLAGLGIAGLGFAGYQWYRRRTHEMIQGALHDEAVFREIVEAEAEVKAPLAAYWDEMRRAAKGRDWRVVPDVGGDSGPSSPAVASALASAEDLPERHAELSTGPIAVPLLHAEPDAVCKRSDGSACNTELLAGEDEK